jgi:hypothetical protein
MIQTKAMLARVSVSRWNANKHDKKVSAEVDAAHNATNAGRYTKALVDKSHLKALMTSAGLIRSFHYKHTLPWDDEGDRLLPAKTFQKYTDGLRTLRDEDERLRKEFLLLYPQLVAAAPHRLGTLFDPADFPSVTDLPAKYDVKVAIKQIPDAADFRVDVSAEAAEEIRAAITAETDIKFQAAMRDCYVRMEQVVSRIAGTLKEDDPRIFDTLVTNAQDLVECLPDLNLADDPHLEQLRQDLAAMLPKSAKALKHNPDLRKQVADNADTILAKMVGYV